MSGRGLIGLVVLATLVLVGTLYVVEYKTPAGAPESHLLFPKLAARPNSASEVSIRTYEQHIVVRKDHRGDWELPDRGGYPADFKTVRRLLLAAAEARVLEYKTDNPTLYPKLGIQGIESETSPSIELVVNNKTGEPLAHMILGHFKTPGSASGVVSATKSYYVKLPDEPRGLLVRGDLEISRQVRDWLDGLILDIASVRIKDIKVKHPDMNVRIYRQTLDAPDFTLADIPAGKELKSQTQLNRMGDILREFRIDDVAEAATYEFGDAVVHTYVETIDGLVIESRAEYIDGVSNAAFTADTLEHAEPQQQQEAASLNDRLGPWVFQIPFYKYDTLARKIGPLIQDVDHQASPPPPLDLPGDPAPPPASPNENSASAEDG